MGVVGKQVEMDDKQGTDMHCLRSISPAALLYGSAFTLSHCLLVQMWLMRRSSRAVSKLLTRHPATGHLQPGPGPSCQHMVQASYV